MFEFLAPGMLVTHPLQSDWGVGQIQSRIGSKVTVNFEHRGKVVINGIHVALQLVHPQDLPKECRE